MASKATILNVIDPADREFLLSQQQHERTAREGNWVSNLDISVQARLAEIYRKYVNPNFVLQKYCGTCVLELVQRLYRWFRSIEPGIENDTPTQSNDEHKDNLPEDSGVTENPGKQDQGQSGRRRCRQPKR